MTDVRTVGLAVLQLLACFASIGCGTADDQVARYCEYGSASEAQLKGCIEHVDRGSIDRRSSNAARYARGELEACLSDAGPFCRD